MAQSSTDASFIRIAEHGFVRLVEVMGDDESVVQAARVSSGRGSKGEESDARLIDYLMRNRHTSPFEMVETKWHIKAPIFVERQWFRHRTASINSASGRYKELADEYWTPDPHKVRTQSRTNKQGSEIEEFVAPDKYFDVAADMAIDQQHLDWAYRHYLGLGVARELARVNLPLSLYTEWYWKIDLHNLFHFLKLRLDPNAQQEIRDYAKAVAQLIRPVVPVSWAAFEEHQLYSVTLSRSQAQAVLSSGLKVWSLEGLKGVWEKLAQSGQDLVE